MSSFLPVSNKRKLFQAVHIQIDFVQFDHLDSSTIQDFVPNSGSLPVQLFDKFRAGARLWELKENLL